MLLTSTCVNLGFARRALDYHRKWYNEDAPLRMARLLTPARKLTRPSKVGNKDPGRRFQAGNGNVQMVGGVLRGVSSWEIVGTYAIFLLLFPEAYGRLPVVLTRFGQGG